MISKLHEIADFPFNTSLVYGNNQLVTNYLTHFADPYVDMIMADGISLLCNDLQVAISFTLYDQTDCRDVLLELTLSWTHKKTSRILCLVIRVSGVFSFMVIITCESSLLLAGGPSGYCHGMCLNWFSESMAIEKASLLEKCLSLIRTYKFGSGTDEPLYFVFVLATNSIKFTMVVLYFEAK